MSDIYVNDGEVVSGTTLSSTMFVSSGGVASNTTVSDSGSMNILSSGSAYGTTILEGGTMVISSGSACSTEVSGGTLTTSDSTISGTTIGEGGVLNANFFTSAYDTIISSGGSATFSECSDLKNITVLSGGTLTLQDDITLDGTITVSGYLYTGDNRVSCRNVDYITLDITEKSITDTAMVTNTDNLNTKFHINISSEQGYGLYQISEGLSSRSTPFYLYIDGEYISESYTSIKVTTDETNVKSISYKDYTYEFIQTSTNLAINVLEIQQTIVDNLVVSSGEYSYASWSYVLNNAVIEDGGFLGIKTDAKASGITVNHGGITTISDDARVDNTNIYGEMTVLGSAVATNNIVNSAGGLSTTQYGTIESTTILDGGLVSTVNNGIANDTTIEDGGIMEVAYWANANDTKVTSGGRLLIAYRGVATDVSNDSGEVIVEGKLNITKATTLDTLNVAGGTVEITTDDANIGTATVDTKGSLTGGSYGMILGSSSDSGVTIELNNAQVNSLMAGAGINSSVEGNVAVNIKGESSTEAWTANIFGGGVANQDISISGTTTTNIEGGNYTGLIYGGSRIESNRTATVGDTAITVTNVTQTNNPIFGSLSSAWLVGGGQAMSATLTTGSLCTRVIDSTVGYIVGGVQAEGSGVAKIDSVAITVENSTVTSNIFGSGYTNGSAQVTVNGDINITINSTESATIQGDIYLGGNNVGGQGSLSVLGDGVVTFIGSGDSLSFTGLVSGLGKGNSTIEGTTSVEFANFIGEFGGTLADIDAINFAGNSVVTMANSYEVSTIGFDLTERTDLDLFLTDTTLDLVGDERVVNLTINEGEFNYNLMEVSDEDLTGVTCKVFDTDGTALGSFDLLEESLALGGYELSFNIDDSDILAVKSTGNLA